MMMFWGLIEKQFEGQKIMKNRRFRWFVVAYQTPNIGHEDRSDGHLLLKKLRYKVIALTQDK